MPGGRKRVKSLDERLRSVRDASRAPAVESPNLEAPDLEAPAYGAPGLEALIAGYGPTAPAKPASASATAITATDRELSEVHDQHEALRTAASEGDTFLPGRAEMPHSSFNDPPGDVS